MIHGFWLLTVFAKSFILDVWLGSEHAFVSQITKYFLLLSFFIYFYGTFKAA